MSEHTLEDEIREVDEAEERQRQLLAKLLDRFSNLRGRVFAIKAEMGYAEDYDGTRRQLPSYTTTHTLEWIAKNIYMGSDMPFMETYIDQETGRIIIDETNAEQLRQRAPDWRRQPALSAYLAHDKKRKFGSILAVVSPRWVDDPDHDNWDQEGRALKGTIDFESLDSSGVIGLINMEDVLVYALDGQHRIMGIRGIKELQEGGLSFKNRDGTPTTSKRIPRDEFLAWFGMDISELQELLGEKMVVEYLPAVVAGETRTEATQRVRDVFVNINQYAMRPDKGENILLDESDGFAIVARNIGTTHKLFKTTDGESRVNWKSSTITKASESLTTLQTVREIVEGYLKTTDPARFEEWIPKFKGQVPIRPSEDELTRVTDQVAQLFDYFYEMPIIRRLESGDSIKELREFAGEKMPDGGGHLLLRPFGQERLSVAVGQVQREGDSLDNIFVKLKQFDRNDGFNVQPTSSPWYGVTYDPNKKSMITRTKDLTLRVFVYLLRGAKQKEREQLLADLVEARAIDDEHWMSFTGGIERKADATADELPQPISVA